MCLFVQWLAYNPSVSLAAMRQAPLTSARLTGELFPHNWPCDHILLFKIQSHSGLRFTRIFLWLLYTSFRSYLTPHFAGISAT
jgi:hypothetical protein